jgi:hypothetical protein
MFVKCRFGKNENGYQGTERGFFSKTIEAQKPLSVYAHLSQFER